MCWQYWKKKVGIVGKVCADITIRKGGVTIYLLRHKSAGDIESTTQNRRLFQINIKIISIFYEVAIRRRQHAALEQNIEEDVPGIYMIFQTYLDNLHVREVTSQEGGIPLVRGLSWSLRSVFSSSYKQ